MANLLVDAGPRLSAGVGRVKEDRRSLQWENRLGGVRPGKRLHWKPQERRTGLGRYPR